MQVPRRCVSNCRPCCSRCQEPLATIGPSSTGVLSSCVGLLASFQRLAGGRYFTAACLTGSAASPLGPHRCNRAPQQLTDTQRGLAASAPNPSISGLLLPARSKAEAIAEALSTGGFQFAFLHVKAVDDTGHDFLTHMKVCFSASAHMLATSTPMQVLLALCEIFPVPWQCSPTASCSGPASHVPLLPHSAASVPGSGGQDGGAAGAAAVGAGACWQWAVQVGGQGEGVLTCACSIAAGCFQAGAARRDLALAGWLCSHPAAPQAAATLVGCFITAHTLLTLLPCLAQHCGHWGPFNPS